MTKANIEPETPAGCDTALAGVAQQLEECIKVLSTNPHVNPAHLQQAVAYSQQLVVGLSEAVKHAEAVKVATTPHRLTKKTPLPTAPEPEMEVRRGKRTLVDYFNPGGSKVFRVEDQPLVPT